MYTEDELNEARKEILFEEMLFAEQDEPIAKRKAKKQSISTVNWLFKALTGQDLVERLREKGAI